MERPPWVCTVFTQLLLCVALYVALNLGQSQKLSSNLQMAKSGGIRGSGNGVLDFHFVTVSAGSRHPHQRSRLITLMENVYKNFDTKFVINISELGEDDPLMQDGNHIHVMREIPWYTTKASNGSDGYFHKQMKTSLGKTLDIVGVDTGLLMDEKLVGASNVLGDEQCRWLMRTLEAMDGDWHIMVGFHPLMSWIDKMDQGEENRDSMHLDDLPAKFGVNVYMSGVGCPVPNFQDGIAYIENPSLVSKSQYVASSYGTSSILSREAVLLLHRVTQLEMVTYFFNVHGEVIHQTVLRQQGKKEAM